MKLPKFKRAFVEITNNCNLACSFCAVTKRKGQAMSTELFQKIINQVQPLVSEVVLHVLGEPLTHPKLLEFIDYALSAGLTVMITTNGTLLTGELAKNLAARKIRQINISLHALEQVKDKSLYLERVFGFVEESQVLNPQGYINLRLWNILSADNQWVLEQLNSRFNTQHVLPANLEDLKATSSLPLYGRVCLSLDAQFSWPNLQAPLIGTQGSCYGLRSHFGVLVDGTVIPCCLDSAGVINLGNILTEDLINILNSPRARAMSNGFQQKRCIEPLCQHCGYRQRFK